LDCFTNGSNFWGYWRKRLCVQWFWTLIRFFWSKCNNIYIFSRSCLAIDIFYFSHITFGDFFLEMFCWVEEKEVMGIKIHWKWFYYYFSCIYLCSNSKWKFVPNPFFTNEKVDRLPNLQWIVIWHER
jgi:hypothetical protein